MSLLGIDIGTTGCKAVVFSENGTIDSLAYREYDIQRPKPRQAELDAASVWGLILEVIQEAVQQSGGTSIQGISATSMGENMVPVSEDRHILGPSILNVDHRGEEFIPSLEQHIPNIRLHEINGNVWGNQYSLPKLMWIRQYQPELYERTYKFLHWASFATFMLGSEPCIDYSLANRSLLFDINREGWSDPLLELSGIDRDKLPRPVPSGTAVGQLGRQQAEYLGLKPGIPLVSGAHDQCANALGCGVVKDHMAMYGMGTFPTIAPVFTVTPDRDVLIRNGLNIEHHAVPGKFVSFLFHMGGSTVKWYRDNLARDVAESARSAGTSAYPMLYEQMPEHPAPVLVLPRFAPMGPPDYEDDPFGSILGMSIETGRGSILKGLIEGNTLALQLLVEQLPKAGIDIREFRAVGGGSRNDRALQIAVDILGKPFTRSPITEAGALGAALLAGIGAGIYRDAEDAAQAISHGDGEFFEPDQRRHRHYQEVFGIYKETRNLLKPISQKWNDLRKTLEQQ